jgi:hypothetical protein
MESPLAQRIDWSTDVFIGKVIEVRPLDAVRMEVLESFKGSTVGEIAIAVDGGDCDYFLPPVDPKIKQNYLIFMSTIAGKNSVSRCPGSGPVESKTEEISILRSGPKT